MSVRPISTICLCRCSTVALCSGVCGGVVKCEIPCYARKGLNLRNSPPLSDYNEIIGKLKNFSTMFLNLGKMRETLDLFFKG